MIDHNDSVDTTNDQPVPDIGTCIPVARPVQLFADPPLPNDDPIFLARWSGGQALRDVVFVTCALVVSTLLIEFGLSLYVDFPSVDSPEFHVVSRELLVPMLMVRVAVTAALIWGVLGWRGQPARSIGLGGRADIVDWIINIALGVGCTVTAYAWLFTWLLASSYFWPGWFDEMGANKQQLVNAIPAMHPAWFVPLMLAVSGYEELLFRGFMMTRLRRTFSGWTPAVIVSALVFTLAHLGDQKLAAMPIIAGLAVIFSIATIWRRSLVPAIVGHFLFNFSQMIGIYLSSPEWR